MKNDLRQIESFRLKIAGHSYREIASELSCSASTAFADVKKELQRISQKERLTLIEMRRLELQRLDKIAQLLMRSLESDGEIKAATPLLKCIEVRCNLAGLFPKKLAEVEAIECLVESGMLEENTLLRMLDIGTAYQENLRQIFEEGVLSERSSPGGR